MSAEEPSDSKCNEPLVDEKLMIELLHRGKHQDALTLLQQTSTINVRMINMGFSARVAAGQRIETSSMEMLQLCEANELAPTRAMYNNVLAALSRSSTPEAVLSWINRMRESRVGFDRIACNMHLKALASSGDLVEATNLLTAMMRNGGEGELPSPDAASFNTVITAIAHHGHHPSNAENLLTMMLDSGLEADTRSFKGVIIAYANAAQPDKAAKWLERMLTTTTLLPDTRTFNAVLLAYANACDCEGAFRLLGSVESRVRDECPNAKPDVISFNTLISACAKASKPIRAEEAFAQMEKRGLVPTAVTFSSVLQAHARVGDPVKAQAWLDTMIERGVAPDAVRHQHTPCTSRTIGSVLGRCPSILSAPHSRALGTRQQPSSASAA